MKRLMLSAALLAALAFGPAHAFASTVTVNFTGTVTGIDRNFGGPSSFTVGEAISGSMTFGPFATDNPAVQSDATGVSWKPWDTDTAAFSIGPVSGSAAGSEIYDRMTPALHTSFMQFFIPYGGAPGNGADLYFSSSDTAAPLLNALHDIPADLAGFLALFGPNMTATGDVIETSSAVSYAVANFQLDSLSISVNETAVSPTPIPATLPLFVSALTGLGWAGWRRRKRASAAS
jgi:hypothetical protein